MRMAGPDVVLFIVGALLFGGALTAIIVTQGPEAFTGPAASASGIYKVTYGTASVQAAKKAVADYSTAGSVKADVNGTNIKTVKVSVECTDSQAGSVAPFAISVTVKGPHNQTAKKDGTCGSPIVLDFAINPLPSETSAAGSTPEAAKESLPKGANDTAATGQWTVSFTGARSAPAGGGLPVQPPGTAPSGNIVVSVETYAPKLEAVQK